MNGAGVCSVIRIVLFLIALSAIIQVLHVLTNFCTSEASNFQSYALCYTSDTFPWIPFLCRMSHYQSEYCRGKPCWHTTFMNSEHRIRRINLWQPGYIYCLLVFQGGGTNSISIPFWENEWSWGVQCHQDSLVSHCSFSFHTGVTCIDKFLYIGSQQFPVICFMLYFWHISLNSFPV